MRFQRRRLNARIYRVDEDELNALKKRTDIVAVFIISLMALLIARLWYLQIHRGAEYVRLAENNRVRALDITAPRGNILDRQGRVIIANRPSFNIVWTKEDAPDPDAVIKRLARLTGDDIALFLERIRLAADNPRHIPIKLKEDVDWQTLAAVENNHLELPGVRIMALPRRDYLYQDLASHLIGYLGEISQKELEGKKDEGDESYESGDPIGKMGAEKLFEEHLRGEKGREYMEVDARGFEQRRLKGLEAMPGNDIRLTIDIDLQQAAEAAMAGKAGAVVAMEVNTGRVLVLVSSPALKLKEFIGGISQKAWKEMLTDPLHPLINKTVNGQYPPGSTYKIVTALAGLAEGAITPETSVFCTGAINFGNRLGVDLLAEYAKSFGFGRASGIELEHEKSGLVPTSEWKQQTKKVAWQKGETLSVAIGQGFNLTTPLQICRMAATLANGGTLYRPQLIELIKGPDGSDLQRFSPVIEGRLRGTDKMQELIRDALTAVVNEPHGTGSAARLPSIKVAGKTGTAQVIRLAQYKGVAENNVPYKYRDHAWFTCFAPAEKPEIAMAVLVEHGSHGGSAAGPVAKRVLEAYFNIKKEETGQPEPTEEAAD